MIKELISEFDLNRYDITFVNDNQYLDLADKSSCIIRINELDYEWEPASKIAIYKDELRINCNLDKIKTGVSTLYNKDGITTEQIKLIAHVIDENKELPIYISSNNINNIQQYLFGIAL